MAEKPGEINFSKEYKLYCNALKMLKARGYTVPEEDIDRPSEEQYQAKVEANPRNIDIFKHETDASKSIALNMNIERHLPFNDKTIESLISLYIKSCVGMIIVTKVAKKNGTIPVDAKAWETVRQADKSNFRIEFVKEENLMFCLMEHELVPKHQLITPAEKKELLER